MIITKWCNCYRTRDLLALFRNFPREISGHFNIPHFVLNTPRWDETNQSVSVVWSKMYPLLLNETFLSAVSHSIRINIFLRSVGLYSRRSFICYPIYTIIIIFPKIKIFSGFNILLNTCTALKMDPIDQLCCFHE